MGNGWDVLLADSKLKPTQTVLQGLACPVANTSHQCAWMCLEDNPQGARMCRNGMNVCVLTAAVLAARLEVP
jgi:hypothetical protein